MAILLQADKVRTDLVKAKNGCMLAARIHGTESKEYQDALRQLDRARSQYKQLIIELTAEAKEAASC